MIISCPEKEVGQVLRECREESHFPVDDGVAKGGRGHTGGRKIKCSNMAT